MEQPQPTLSSSQGENVIDLYRLLLNPGRAQHPALAQQQFSSERVPTVSRVFPAIEFLLTSLETAQKDPMFAPIHGAITAGVSNLSKWYRTLDSCHVYVVSNGASNYEFLLCLTNLPNSSRPINQASLH